MGPTGVLDGVILQSNGLTGSSMVATNSLENSTTYEFSVWVRRLSGPAISVGRMRVDSDFDNVADAVERQEQAFGVVPLVWTKKVFRFTTGLFASAAPSTISYTAGADVGSVIAYAQPQLAKVTKTNIPGQWFETSHVNLVVDPLSYEAGTLAKAVDLFYALANYHLVLNTIMFEFTPYIHPPGEDIGVIVKAYPMIDIEPTIYSKDPPALAPSVFNVSSPSWQEGGDLIFNVTLNKSSSVPNSYAYSKTGTATQGVDYTGPVFSDGVALVGSQLQVPPGVSAFTVTFALIADGVSEGNETIILTIGGQTGTGNILNA